jgi:transcription termination/antitermination protein NusG
MAKNWYVVHTYSGFEEKVKLAIEERTRIKGLEEQITRILIPTERVIELRVKRRRRPTESIIRAIYL